jgi:hypothetical protein
MVKGILALKSAFSVIDQMFQQEIINQEYIQKNWLWVWLGCQNKKKIINPLALNSFIDTLMDPFKDGPR